MSRRTYDSIYLICPYCGYSHDDTWEIFDEIEEEIDSFECHHCEKTFVAIKSATFYYEGRADDESE